MAQRLQVAFYRGPRGDEPFGPAALESTTAESAAAASAAPHAPERVIQAPLQDTHVPERVIQAPLRDGRLEHLTAEQVREINAELWSIGRRYHLLSVIQLALTRRRTASAIRASASSP